MGGQSGRDEKARAKSGLPKCLNFMKLQSVLVILPKDLRDVQITGSIVESPSIVVT